MTIGTELDKQIYPEGNNTWGCKSGWLDVEDVKEFIERLRKKAKKYIPTDKWVINEEDLIEEAGEKLLK